MRNDMDLTVSAFVAMGAVPYYKDILSNPHATFWAVHQLRIVNNWLDSVHWCLQLITAN